MSDTSRAPTDDGRRLASEPERLERFAARVAEYHDVSLDEILEVLDYLRDEGDSMIAGGSLSIGFGNRLSDLDIVIAGPSTSSSAVPLEHWVKSLRVDAWTRNQSAIDDLFRQADEHLRGERPIQGAFGGLEEEQQLKLLHRVAFGLHVDGPPLEPTSTRRYVEVARDLIVREYAERMRESAYVAQLALAAGGGLAAAVNARYAVEEALHAVLAARGLPFSGDKWLGEQLRDDAPDLDDLHGRFAILPAGAPDDFVRDAVTHCQRLVGIELGVATLAAAHAWTWSGLQLLKVGADQLLVSPPYGALWRLDEDEVAAWRGLSAGDADRCAGADCDAAATALCLRLYERGLARLEWERGLPVAELSIEGGAG